MNPIMFGLIGFLGGLGFGLMVAWGMLSLLFAAIGVAVLLIGALVPSMFRGIFGFGVIGFMVAFVAAGGFSLL